MSDLSKKSPSFQIRPGLDEKFRSKAVEELLSTCVPEQLNNFQYSEEAVNSKAVELATYVRQKMIEELKYPRYKFCVNVVFGEHKGQGVRITARCLWDSDTDNYATKSFVMETYFCKVTVFGVYHY